MAQRETLTLVIYDISHDRTRTKVSEACLDFGLVRFQYSAFEGHLTRNRREELALRLEKLIERRGGRVTLLPVCRGDCEARINLDIQPPDPEPAPDRGPRLKLYVGDDSP